MINLEEIDLKIGMKFMGLEECEGVTGIYIKKEDYFIDEIYNYSVYLKNGDNKPSLYLECEYEQKNIDILKNMIND